MLTNVEFPEAPRVRTQLCMGRHISTARRSNALEWQMETDLGDPLSLRLLTIYMCVHVSVHVCVWVYLVFLQMCSHVWKPEVMPGVFLSFSKLLLSQSLSLNPEFIN